MLLTKCRADNKHYWQVHMDHFKIVYLQCGVYSYSTSEMIFHDVGKIEKVVISTHTDYVKSHNWMVKHIELIGKQCD